MTSPSFASARRRCRCAFRQSGWPGGRLNHMRVMIRRRRRAVNKPAAPAGRIRLRRPPTLRCGVMNHIYFVIFALTLSLMAANFAIGVGGDDKASADAKGELLHVVSLKFKPGSTPEQIKLVEQAFAGLKEKIPGITSLKWGTN